MASTLVSKPAVASRNPARGGPPRLASTSRCSPLMEGISSPPPTTVILPLTSRDIRTPRQEEAGRDRAGCPDLRPGLHDLSAYGALPADLDPVAADDDGHEDRVLQGLVEPLLLRHDVALLEVDALLGQAGAGPVAGTTVGRRVEDGLHVPLEILALWQVEAPPPAAPVDSARSPSMIDLPWLQHRLHRSSERPLSWRRRATSWPSSAPASRSRAASRRSAAPAASGPESASPATTSGSASSRTRPRGGDRCEAAHAQGEQAPPAGRPRSRTRPTTPSPTSKRWACSSTW